MARRIVFMLILPFAVLAYMLTSRGRQIHFMAPTALAGFIGFLSNLAMTECLGLLMEAFDTSDLCCTSPRNAATPCDSTRCARSYTSFPRVSAGFFASQSIGYLLAATATGIGGTMTRNLGAQLSAGATAAILLGLTLLLTAVLWRYKRVQVIPDQVYGTAQVQEGDWQPVVIGNSSGKWRRMNCLETGHLSRWTEVRKLNQLMKE
jgi:hypothetical protein